ncbi:hypothetical protein BJV82DRAFT_584614 [Fennellomyces sp. T-0311]|nr:hypothetical protein BJV82DRAFT_584614 [Fennellomyces sp. T-0311]
MCQLSTLHFVALTLPVADAPGSRCSFGHKFERKTDKDLAQIPARTIVLRHSEVHIHRHHQREDYFAGLPPGHRHSSLVLTLHASNDFVCVLREVLAKFQFSGTHPHNHTRNWARHVGFHPIVDEGGLQSCFEQRLPLVNDQNNVALSQSCTQGIRVDIWNIFSPTVQNSDVYAYSKTIRCRPPTWRKSKRVRQLEFHRNQFGGGR